MSGVGGFDEDLPHRRRSSYEQVGKLVEGMHVDGEHRGIERSGDLLTQDKCVVRSLGVIDTDDHYPVSRGHGSGVWHGGLARQLVAIP